MGIRVIVNGANGKMGRYCCTAIEQDPELTLVGKLDHSDSLPDSIAILQAEVVVDFTSPHAVFENTLAIVNAHARPVIGTTGLTTEQIQQLQKIANEKKLGGLIAPNFSIGAVLMMQFSKQAAAHFSQSEIIESHHPAKLDSPSGTALKTAAMIAEGRQQVLAALSAKQHVEDAPARGLTASGCTIHSIRLPGIVADQQVIFANASESLQITHHTVDRSCFMPGVLLACKRVLQAQNLFYGLEHFL